MHVSSCVDASTAACFACESNRAEICAFGTCADYADQSPSTFGEGISGALQTDSGSLDTLLGAVRQNTNGNLAMCNDLLIVVPHKACMHAIDDIITFLVPTPALVLMLEVWTSNRLISKT